jgi:GMP synthase (glutamine-hydrolysing)
MRPSTGDLQSADVVLMGGSGDYSVLDSGRWMEQAQEAMRELHEMSKPTFASCWGFQAMAKALGGVVVRDPELSEISSVSVGLTGEGRADQVFGGLENPFRAHSAHEDTVTELPSDAVLLASSSLVENQAFKFSGKPIYCTQFHPELTKKDIELRLKSYPKYVEELGGGSLEKCMSAWVETPVAESIIPRFIDYLAKR